MRRLLVLTPPADAFLRGDPALAGGAAWCSWTVYGRDRPGPPSRLLVQILLERL
jgi:hypothetical protein